MTDLGIKITVSGKKALDQLYDERGIKKLVIVGRVMEWVAAQDKTLQSVILGQADPVDSLEVLAMIERRLTCENETPDQAAGASYFLRLVDRHSDVLKTMTKAEQLGVKKLIALLEAAAADVSPAARIVDEAVASVKAQQRKSNRPARSKEA